MLYYLRYSKWIRNTFYHLFYVDYSIESSHDFRGEQGRRNGEQSVCDCYSLCYVTIILICGWEPTDFFNSDRVSSFTLIDSIVLSPSCQQNREDAWNSQHYDYPPGFSRWDSLYPCCNHENLSEQTEVRVDSFQFCIFTLLSLLRASMFFMLAF